MKIIVEADKTVLNVLGKAKNSKENYRMMSYCVGTEVEDGVLLFNVLTRELLLLTKEEYADYLNLEYLREKWFVVSETLNEKEYANLVRWALGKLRKKSKHITKYTIMTTTDCNARCFYCYEKGIKKFPMSEETALKTADFIKENCGGEKVTLGWFGGEPLYNSEVIDVICERLKEEEVDYQSSMVSNGYLFREELIEKAVHRWNLQSIQITLDGTEEVYNRSKAYIYSEGSAYQIVLANIQKLLDAGVLVSIRMNMNLENAENLFDLIDELEIKFRDEKKLNAYVHLIFDDEKLLSETYSEEEITRLYRLLEQMEEKLSSAGLSSESKKGLAKKVKTNYCMVDSENAVVITPDGHLGLCEHYAESNYIGHIASQELDNPMIEKLRQLRDEQPECKGCFYYPECVGLKICNSSRECLEQERIGRRRKLERAMQNELLYWKIRNSRKN